MSNRGTVSVSGAYVELQTAVLKALPRNIEDEVALNWANNGEALTRFLSGLCPSEQVAKTVEGIFFTPLADKDVPKKLVDTMVKWRKLATELDYSGPLAWQVREGFTLKTYALKAGPCYNNFSYLQDWSLRNDEPTSKALAFWVPRLVPESVNKNVTEQMELLGGLRQRLGLPACHLVNFGSAAMLSGLILAHFEQTGERTPLECLWTRTDTLHAGGYRLHLGAFDENGLRCDDWRWDGYRSSSLGCFPLGVELGF